MQPLAAPRRRMTDEATALTLARWFDSRLHDSVGFAIRGTRLYGLEVIDAEALDAGEPWAARVSLILEAADALVIADTPGAQCVSEFDAAALVSVAWKAVAESTSCRPGRFARRRRMRLLDVIVGDATVTIVRFEDEPEPFVLASAS